MRPYGIYVVFVLAVSITGLARAGMPAGNMGMSMDGGKPMAANVADSREGIPLTEEERALVAANMRQMLASVQGVTDALARGDGKTAAEAASKSGVVMMQELPVQIRMKFPPPFAQMGMASHKLFDRIAREAKTAKGPAPILKLLSESMQQCVACTPPTASRRRCDQRAGWGESCEPQRGCNNIFIGIHFIHPNLHFL